MAKKDGEAEEVGGGPNDDKIKGLQNTINDLTLGLDALKKSKGDAAEFTAMRGELDEAKKELAALKKQKPGSSAGDESEEEPAAAGGGYEYGFFS